ncbi:putative T6SS immunity periplasmic lipoprotein [Enterobacter sp.]|uniref:putative T6SS immunity periplasmic lipoprotein n=1 Tax=Enterobacter sp. TaxID=42895 RepID=UPI0031D2240D
MVSKASLRRCRIVFLSFFCPLILTGCPGPGDRMRMDQTTLVELRGDNVCMSIRDSQDYQPVDMAINPRGTPSKEKKFDVAPALNLVDGRLCIPPSYYHFTSGKKYIVEFVLHSPSIDEPRSFVVAVGVSNDNKVYNFALTSREIARPYGSIEGSE